jgi:hypothetical protein
MVTVRKIVRKILPEKIEISLDLIYLGSRITIAYW